MKQLLTFFIIVLLCISSKAQKNKADSLMQLLYSAKHDTTKVFLMWNLANAFQNFNPDTASEIAYRAVTLSKAIKYEEGISRSLGIYANTFLRKGNYPKALEYYFEKLQLEEKRHIPRNMGSVLMNIGIVYSSQEEFDVALGYYKKADSIITTKNIDELKYSIALNIGDLYDRKSVLDSTKKYSDTAYTYFSKAYLVAEKNNDNTRKNTARVGIANCLYKQKEFLQAASFYSTSIVALKQANNDDLLCEAYMGLARVNEKLNKNDSAIYHAKQSLFIAQKDAFETRELEATALLTTLYKKSNNTDSAYAYLIKTQVLKDSVDSKQRIRQSQILSSNEIQRQKEEAEKKEKEKKERKQQLQLLFIGIFIPAFFIFTLLLSRIKINVRLIKFMGIISLLIFFEYLTLLLHPYVVELTHHTPLLEILIFVTVAAFLIPAHHKLEAWFIEKITKNRETFNLSKIKIKKLKYNPQKNPSIQSDNSDEQKDEF